MSFNIQRFRANSLTEGGARPSLFEVVFPNITNLQTLIPLTQLGDDQMVFKCHAASLPSFRLNEIPVFYFGRPVYYAADRDFDPWRVSIYNDEDFKLRDFFEAWSNQINELVGNVAAASNPRNYKVDEVMVRQWGKDGTLLREYRFYGMWPSLVGDIQLGWDQGNRIETFDCIMRYDFFIPSKAGMPDEEQKAPPSYDPGMDDASGLSSKVISS